DLRLLEMDPGAKELLLDVDGKVMKFSAGDTAAQTLTWPSARVASQIKLSFGGTPQLFEGPWAFFRLIGQNEVQASPQPERFTVGADMPFDDSPGYTGVLMPSVDRVGRYFPLTVARPRGVGQSSASASWLEALERVAVAALDADWGPERFDDELARLDEAAD